MAAIVSGRRRLNREEGRVYVASVDMSGGSSDDAVLAIAHYDQESKRAVLDALISQTGSPPLTHETPSASSTVSFAPMASQR